MWAPMYGILDAMCIISTSCSLLWSKKWETTSSNFVCTCNVSGLDRRQRLGWSGTGVTTRHEFDDLGCVCRGDSISVDIYSIHTEYSVQSTSIRTGMWVL